MILSYSSTGSFPWLCVSCTNSAAERELKFAGSELYSTIHSQRLGIAFLSLDDKKDKHGDEVPESLPELV